jgi:hypothetical protein
MTFVRALQHTQSPRGEGGGESKDIERQREREERRGEEWRRVRGSESM